MRTFGFAGLATGLAMFAPAAPAAADSGPDQQRWGDVPRAELKLPGRHSDVREIHRERHEGRYHSEDYIDDRDLPPPPGYDLDFAYDGVTSGTWEGTWQGQYDDGRPYSYSGSFDGEYRPAGAHYPAPYDDVPPHHAPGHNPAILHHGSQVIINGMAYPAGGTVSNGYYYPPATTTTITVHSGCCQQVEPAAAWQPKPKKHWKPKPKSKIIRMTK